MWGPWDSRSDIRTHQDNHTCERGNSVFSRVLSLSGQQHVKLSPVLLALYPTLSLSFQASAYQQSSTQIEYHPPLPQILWLHLQALPFYVSPGGLPFLASSLPVRNLLYSSGQSFRWSSHTFCWPLQPNPVWIPHGLMDFPLCLYRVVTTSPTNLISQRLFILSPSLRNSLEFVFNWSVNTINFIPNYNTLLATWGVTNLPLEFLKCSLAGPYISSY